MPLPSGDDFGIDGPDGDALWGKDAEAKWKELYVDQWCLQMIGLYGIEHMLQYPYAADFGIDGPDGNALYGRDAEKEWRKRYKSCHRQFRDMRMEARRTYRESRQEKRGGETDPWCKQVTNAMSRQHVIATHTRTGS